MLYVDPGTGLFVLQGAISAVMGIVFLARQRVKGWLQSVFRRGSADAGVDAAGPKDEAGSEDGPR